MQCNYCNSLQVIIVVINKIKFALIYSRNFASRFPLAKFI